MFRSFFPRQLAQPSGLFGRLFMTRWLEKANADMNTLTLKELALDRNDRLLELGFGSGYLLEHVLTNRLCEFVAGVDVSSDMVKHASRRFRPYVKSGKAEIRRGSIESIPYDDGAFTKLCSVNTLYFWQDAALALAECRRVLRPGSQMSLCFNAKSDMARWSGHVHGFTLYELSEVQDMLVAEGFSMIQTVSEIDEQQGLFHCVTGIIA